MLPSNSTYTCEKINFCSYAKNLTFIYYPKSNISGFASTQKDWQEIYYSHYFSKGGGVSSLPQNHVRIQKAYGVQKTWKILFGP